MTTTLPNLNTEYRAKITLNNNVVCTITGSDQRAVQDAVQNLFVTQNHLSPTQRGKPMRFEQTENNSTIIFHDAHMDGNQPLGWIAEYDVPKEMSVVALSEYRFKIHRAA